MKALVILFSTLLFFFKSYAGFESCKGLSGSKKTVLIQEELVHLDLTLQDLTLWQNNKQVRIASQHNEKLNVTLLNVSVKKELYSKLIKTKMVKMTDIKRLIEVEPNKIQINLSLDLQFKEGEDFESATQSAIKNAKYIYMQLDNKVFGDNNADEEGLPVKKGRYEYNYHLKRVSIWKIKGDLATLVEDDIMLCDTTIDLESTVP